MQPLKRLQATPERGRAALLCNNVASLPKPGLEVRGDAGTPVSIGIQFTPYKKLGKRPIICHPKIHLKDLNRFYKHGFKFPCL